MKIFNLFITYGDTFLPNPTTYDELYYELIRVHKVFDDLYMLGKTSVTFVEDIVILLMFVWYPQSLSWFLVFYLLAMKCAQNGNPYPSTAAQLVGNLVNVRSIAAHFRPKIDAWSTAHQVVTLTPDQVGNLLVSMCMLC